MKNMRTSTALLGAIALAASVSAQVAEYGQCGGIGYTGSTSCVSPYACTVINAYYFQCLTAGSGTTTGGSGTTTSATSSTTTKATTTTTKASSTSGSATTTATGAACSTAPASAGKVAYAGVNIAGFDFGCGTDGTCVITGTSGTYPPLASLGNPDGIGQMQHFVNDDKFNIFRLPVGWQYLVNNVLGGTLDASNTATYDELVQGCLATGAYCIIDIHNYARWDGGIIGQGGPTNDQFVSLWTQLATKYASQSKIMFGVMNEPHDLSSVTTWAATVQLVVTAIRNAGATSQIILLPGNDWTSAGTFISDGSAAALSTVKNPDGSFTNLVFDVHKYLDSDNSGTSSTCVTDNIADAFAPLAAWLRCNGRQALNTETGGGNTASCVTYLNSQLQFVSENSDVFLGYVGWAAGSFDSTYTLTLTPTKSGSTWTDVELITDAFKLYVP
ncbi:cellulase-domain-containing protein [Clavulina sp. PMI_390]|nr:cellulase-domain-containing protein [Clavulina sp. PMI_390]